MTMLRKMLNSLKHSHSFWFVSVCCAWRYPIWIAVVGVLGRFQVVRSAKFAKHVESAKAQWFVMIHCVVYKGNRLNQCESSLLVALRGFSLLKMKVNILDGFDFGWIDLHPFRAWISHFHGEPGFLIFTGRNGHCVQVMELAGNMSLVIIVDPLTLFIVSVATERSMLYGNQEFKRGVRFAMFACN